MPDLRVRVPNVAALARQLGVDYSHLHNALKGRRLPSVALAQRIDLATDGGIRWFEFWGADLLPLDVEGTVRESAPTFLASDDKGSAAPADTPDGVLVVPDHESKAKTHSGLLGATA